MATLVWQVVVGQSNVLEPMDCECIGGCGFGDWPSNTVHERRVLVVTLTVRVLVPTGEAIKPNQKAIQNGVKPKAPAARLRLLKDLKTIRPIYATSVNCSLAQAP